MQQTKTDIWTTVLDDIKEQVGPQRFSLWFQNVRPVLIKDDEARFGVPNLFVQEWLHTHFEEVLRKSLAAHLGKSPTVRFVVDPQLFRQSRANELEVGAQIVEEAAVAEEESKPRTHESNLRSDFTLENFIVGPQNKLAHACALEVIESKSNRLNPLFVHSISGLGKTHLLQAIYHELRKRDDGRKAEYVSAESFTNQFIYALRSNRLDAFRNRYRNADVLLVDDVHFLSNKTGLQEELLHTYEALNDGKRQLLLASDVHPKMLNRIKQSLINRFASGMIVRITQPDFATRVAILKAKLQQQHRRVPEDVLRYVARGFEGSVRELSGAVTLVLAYAGLTGEKIDVALARKALSHNGEQFETQRDIQAVERIVVEQFGIKPSDLRARRMRRANLLARYICIYLARHSTTLSCREIARHFGSANHSTVVFAVSKVEQTMASDRNIAELVAALTEKIRKS
jgi:chromosomal replication initiator protein